MAATDVLVCTENWTGNGHACSSTLPLTTGWDERSLKIQLGNISKAWVCRALQSRNFGWVRNCDERQLIVSDSWVRSLLQCSSYQSTRGPPQYDAYIDETDQFARRRLPPSAERHHPDNPNNVANRTSTTCEVLFSGPVLDFDVDFASQEGFKEKMAKKKNKARNNNNNNNNKSNNNNQNNGPAKSSDDPEDGQQEGDGQADEGSGDKESGGGSGAPNDGSGDGAGDGDKDGDKDGNNGDADDTTPDPEEFWGFQTANRKKKKGKKGADSTAEPVINDVLANDHIDGLSQDIKIGDDTGGKLELDFTSTDNKKDVSSWGASWDWPTTNSGTTIKANEGSMPCSSKETKTAKKLGTSFSFGEPDEESQGKMPGDSSVGDFQSASSDKTGKGDDIARAKGSQDAVSDVWGWSSGKTKSKGGAFLSLREETVAADNAPNSEPASTEEAESNWGVWGTKKDKKKKKDATEGSHFLPSLSQDSAPDSKMQAEPVDDLLGFINTNTKKGKKKGKAEAAQSAEARKDANPPSVPDKIDENTCEDFATSMTDKKKRMKEFTSFGGLESGTSSAFEAEANPEAPAASAEKNSSHERQAPADVWDDVKLKKDKKKKAATEETKEESAPTDPISSMWNVWPGKTKKDKKNKVSLLDDTDVAVEEDGSSKPGTAVQTAEDVLDQPWANKKDKKKKNELGSLLESTTRGGKGSHEDVFQDTMEATGGDDFFTTFGNAKKIEGNNGPDDASDKPTDAEPTDYAWGAISKKDKKKKSKTKDELVEDDGDLAGHIEARSTEGSAETDSEKARKEKQKIPKLSDKELKKLEKEKKKAEKAEKAERERLQQEAEQSTLQAAEEQVNVEADGKAQVKGEETSQPETEEAAPNAEEAAVIAAEEEEIKCLEKKLAKKKLNKKDSEKYERLKANVEKRAAEQAAHEAEKADRQAKARAAQEAEEAARKAQEEKAAQEAEEAARKAEEEELAQKMEDEASKKAPKKNSKKDKEKDRKKDKKSSTDTESGILQNPEPGTETDLKAAEVEKLLSGEDKPTNNAFSFWGINSGSQKSNKEDAMHSKDGDVATRSKGREAVSAKEVSSRKPIGGKIADRLKTFETVSEGPPAGLTPPPAPPKEKEKSPKSISKDDGDGTGTDKAEHRSSSSKKDRKASEIPGSFPADNGEDDVAAIIDMAPQEKSKQSKKSKAKDATPPPPDPPPPVPDVPSSSSPPAQKPNKEPRPKINGESTSWARWSAPPATRKDDKKEGRKTSFSKNKSDKPSKRPSDKVSSKDSGSEQADRSETPGKPVGKGRVPSTFASMPPISRSMSTREKDRRPGATSGRTSSRRHSVDARGLAAPPEDPGPDMSSKAAKILGIDSSTSRRKSRIISDNPDTLMTGALDVNADSQKRSLRRSRKVLDDDAIMSVETPIKRNASTSRKSGLSGLLSGLMTPKSLRGDPFAEIDTAGDEADRAELRPSRRNRRSERDNVEKPSEDPSRNRHRKKVEASEVQRMEERLARKAERHAARQRAEEERRAAEDREVRRAERRRARKEQEAAALADEARKSVRHEQRPDPELHVSEEDAERRRRRKERLASRTAEGNDVHKRRRSRAQVGESEENERVYIHKEARHDSRHGSMWPHSGTSSWVKDHSDAPPPPEDNGQTDDEQARREAHRARQRARQGHVTADEADEQRRRRARREGRDKERRAGGSEGSDERQQGGRISALTDSSPRMRWWRKLTG